MSGFRITMTRHSAVQWAFIGFWMGVGFCLSVMFVAVVLASLRALS